MLISRSTPRRLLIAVTSLALAAASLTAVSTPASAATSTTTVTVTGTSDVYDSGLIQGVIAPGFEKTDPQYKLNYISEGTGAAISDAENGVSDALIVHAPSLENDFVAGIPYNASATPPGVSYSYEKSGRAIFYGDYVLAGATSDPAGVDPAYPTPAHDIVAAFEQVATAGAAGTANFNSRAGSPGTTVEEHQIWALTTGVAVCTLPNSASVGGGAVPVVPTSSYAGAACPATSIPYPSWYHSASNSQAQNIVLANTCPYGTGNANAHDCYALTDRGTLNYLQSGSSTQAGNLELLVRDNATSAPGGNTLLVNTFHAYVVNPASVTGGSNLNTAGATAFLNYLTSPAAQAAVGQYLSSDNDPPFIPDAAPQLSVTTQPGVVNGGSPVDITGSLSNLVPGTPALAGVKVQLLVQPTSTPNAAYTEVVSSTTLDDGTFLIPFSPTQNEKYEVMSPALSQQLEYPLTPPFSDALQATTTSLGTIAVRGVFTKLVTTTSKGHLKVTGSVDPARVGNNAHLSLYARKAGTSSFTYRGQHTLLAGSHGINATFALAKGKYNVYVTYNNAGIINRGVSATKTVTVS